MNRVLTLNTKIAFAVFVIIDLICVAMGMGVPLACIFFGFLVGWYIAKRATMATANVKDILWKALIQGSLVFVGRLPRPAGLAGIGRSPFGRQIEIADPFPRRQPSREKEPKRSGTYSSFAIHPAASPHQPYLYSLTPGAPLSP